MQPNKQCTGREQRHEQGESTTTDWCYYPQALNQFYLADGATTFIQKQRNGHSQRREWQTGSVDLYNAGPGRPNGSRETVAGYLPPSVVGESRRPVPTAASVAAPDPGPLAWPASSLRRSSHGRAGSRHTAGRAAPDLGPCQGEVIRARPATRLRGTNGSTNALSALALDKS